MKYPILYKSNETDFFTMGLGPIQMLKATVTQERNGIFIFEGEILTDNPLFPLVLENYIIKADADHLLTDQRFRIKRIVPNHSGKAQIYAEHVSYLSRELTIKPEVSITGSAQIALNQWKASIVESNPFVVSSDITTSASTKWRIDKVNNPMMALGGVEGSILDCWGGEYLFDNYHIRLLKKRGTTAQTVLAYGRNITDFEQERNILNTHTSVAPYAIYTDDNEKEIIVTIDGYVVDSEHVDKYPNRVTMPIDFSSEFGHDEIPTKARLTTLAQQYIKDNEIGVPTTSIKISFLDLSQTADYADYAFLEQVNLCDDVRVHYPKLGVNTIAKVVRVVWNCLTESYDEIEIGQKRMSLVGQMQQQQQAIKEINTQTNYAMTSADGKNTIFYGLYGENGLGEPKAIKVGDTWYKPNSTGTDMLVWTGTIWQVVLNAETFNQINEKIDQAEKDIAQNIIDIDAALEKATQAELDAGFSKDLAGEAKALGITASSLAGEATTNANKAMTDVNTLTGRVTSAEGSITTIAGQVALKANSSDVNTLTGRVTTAEGSITTQAGQIALKANQSVVDTLTGRVSTTESKITATDGKVTTLTTKTDGHTTSIGQLQTSYSGLSSTVTQVKNNLEGMEIGGRNYQRNITVGFRPSEAKVITGNHSIDIEYESNTSAPPYVFLQNAEKLFKDTEYILSFYVTLKTDTPFTLHYGLRNGGFSDKSIFLNTVNKRVFVSHVFKPPIDGTPRPIVYKYISGDIVGVSIEKFMIAKGNKATDWSPAPEDYTTVTAFSALEQNLNGFKTTVQNTYADKTQVTQLSTQWTTTTNLVNGHTSQIASLGTDLNLKATKAELISQINLSPESILIASNKIQIKGDTYIDNGVIKTAHIADLAVSGAKIANASIASAKIISLDASKITANTLSAITTNTGTLNVNGWLTTTAENFGFRGTYDYGDNLSGSYNPRWFDGDYRLSHRYLTFQANVHNVTTSNTRGTFNYYTESFYGPDYLKLRQYPSSSNTTLRNRVDITADKFQITKDWSDASGIILNADGSSVFGARGQFNAGLDIGSPDNVGLRVGRIDAPLNFQTLILNDNRNLGTLTLSYDTSRFISSIDIYNRTYSLAANMYVSPNGVLGRATSARKYKSNITTLKSVYSKAKKVLGIRPVTWHDKRALEEVGSVQIGYGFIADDFHDAGLVEVVSYGSDGQVEGLAYDHISIYHNVILKDHEQQLKRLDNINTNVIKLVANDSIYGLRLNNLEAEVFRLKKRIEELEKIA